MELNLTDSEWIRLLDGDSDDSELPRCCANISALRDELMIHVREGRNRPIPDYRLRDLKQKIKWAMDGHDFPKRKFPVLNKIIDAVGPLEEHKPQDFESI